VEALAEELEMEERKAEAQEQGNERPDMSQRLAEEESKVRGEPLMDPLRDYGWYLMDPLRD